MELRSYLRRVGRDLIRTGLKSKLILLVALCMLGGWVCLKSGLYTVLMQEAKVLQTNINIAGNQMYSDYNDRDHRSLHQYSRDSGRNATNIEFKTSPERPIHHSPWTWECRDDHKCHRVERTEAHGDSVISIESCWLTCGPTGSLWPYPTSQCDLGKELVSFQLSNFVIEKLKVPPEVGNLVKAAFQIMLTELGKMGSTKNDSSLPLPKVTLNLSVRRPERTLTLRTDESYSLRISSSERSQTKSLDKLEVHIEADTFFGLRHGLETLSQLIAYNPQQKCFQMVEKAEVEDKPGFPYRGLLLDSARNFIPLPNIRKLIRAMSYNKLNMLHWHMSDSNSFPFYSKSFPKMTDYGAYSASQIYYPAEIADLIEFARVRGVKIIPELDAPAHTGNGWQWGKAEGFGDLNLCFDAEPWRDYCGQPPCGQLNPANPKVYDVLEKVYADMAEVFEKDLFHMGGDEVYFKCWNTPEINEFMQEHNISSNLELWSYFQREAFKRLEAGNGSGPIPIMWTSELTASEDVRDILPPDQYIIQSWEAAGSSRTASLLSEDYPMILSTVDKMFLDWGDGSSLGRDHNWPDISWQTLYDHDLRRFGQLDKEVNNRKYGKIRQILGSEAPLWAEKVNAESMEAKFWPKAAAHAERIWSNPSKRRSGLVYARLLRQNERMRTRGVRTGTRQPMSCLLLHSNCDDPLKAL